jgi:hypothetical protein
MTASRGARHNRNLFDIDGAGSLLEAGGARSGVAGRGT